MKKINELNYLRRKVNLEWYSALTIFISENENFQQNIDWTKPTIMH